MVRLRNDRDTEFRYSIAAEHRVQTWMPGETKEIAPGYASSILGTHSSFMVNVEAEESLSRSLTAVQEPPEEPEGELTGTNREETGGQRRARATRAQVDP